MLADAKAGAVKKADDKKRSAIIKNIEDIVSSGTLDDPFMEFINLFINNRDKDLVQAICLYFNYTNGYLNMEDSEVNDKDKALFSQLARVFSEYQSDTIECLHEYYDQMVEKNKALFDKKKVKVNDSDIIEYIKNNLGESSNLDLEVLKQMIESREE